MSEAPVINTKEFADQIVLKGLWPPKYHTNRLLMAVVPREFVPQVQLADEDYYRLDPTQFPNDCWLGRPLVILGEAILCSNERYYPRDAYAVAEVTELTRSYRRGQKARKDQLAAEEILRKVEDEKERAKDRAMAALEERIKALESEKSDMQLRKQALARGKVT